MSYSSAKWISPKNTFSWWYVDNTVNLFLADKFSPYLRNARLDWESITIRPGHQLFATLTAWSYPKGIWSYLRTVETNDRLVVRHNTDATHKLYSITEAWVATSITTAWNITWDGRMSFVNIWDVIYCFNGADDFGKLDWTTYTVPSSWIAWAFVRFWVVFNGCLWISWADIFPNKVYKSVADDYEDMSWAWSDDFTFQETITWLSANLQALFYFTKNTISVTWVSDITDTAWTITYTNRSLAVKEWAVNHASIVETWSRTYYLTPSNKINMIMRWTDVDWYEALELSERKYQWISKIMSTLDNDQTDSFGYFLPKDNLIKWFVKTQWATFNDLCIVYDLSKDAFLVDGQKFFYWWVNFKNKNYTISMIEEKVYQDEINQDDEDVLIPFEYRTKEFYITDPTYKKILRETRTLVDINELAELKQTLFADWWLIDTKQIDKDNVKIFRDWIWTLPIGTFAIWMPTQTLDEYQETYILRTKWNLNTLWKKFQFRFINNSLAWKVRLKNISMKIEQKPWLATDLTT